jgi:ribonuclease HII
MVAMRMSVLNLCIRPDLLLIDGNMRLRIQVDQRCIIRGDQKSLSIACASIIAKVTRDRLLKFYDQIFPEYGFARHKGYGTASHMLAIRRIGYSPVHRRSFGNNIGITTGQL